MPQVDVDAPAGAVDDEGVLRNRHSHGDGCFQIVHVDDAGELVPRHTHPVAFRVVASGHRSDLFAARGRQFLPARDLGMAVAIQRRRLMHAAFGLLEDFSEI